MVDASFKPGVFAIATEQSSYSSVYPRLAYLRRLLKGRVRLPRRRLLHLLALLFLGPVKAS